MRALAFSDAFPPFARFMFCWCLGCSHQFPTAPQEEGAVGSAGRHVTETVSIAAVSDPRTQERIRCHALMEELGAAARAGAPDGLAGHVDAALEEAVAFNTRMRELGPNTALLVSFTTP